MKKKSAITKEITQPSTTKGLIESFISDLQAVEEKYGMQIDVHNDEIRMVDIINPNQIYAYVGNHKLIYSKDICIIQSDLLKAKFGKEA